MMQNIFWLQDDVSCTLLHLLIKNAIAVYSKSDTMQSLHRKIDKHVKDKNVCSSPDVTLNKVIKLIGCNHIDSAKMFKHQDLIPACNLAEDDEEWESLAT
jgi:hypothetical protein